MRHYTTIEGLIADIEADAEHFKHSQKFAADEVALANRRGYANAYWDIAQRLRLTVIGPDLGTAKELTECR